MPSGVEASLTVSLLRAHKGHCQTSNAQRSTSNAQAKILRVVVITPACGYVDPTGAVIIGIAAGIVPFFACTKLKSWFHYDDALDTFGIHAVGGTVGAFLTGLLATATVNSNLVAAAATENGLLKLVGHTLWLEQLKAIGITISLALIGTALIGLLVRSTIGLRIAPEIERQGLDINLHGEEGY